MRSLILIGPSSYIGWIAPIVREACPRDWQLSVVATHAEEVWRGVQKVASGESVVCFAIDEWYLQDLERCKRVTDALFRLKRKTLCKTILLRPHNCSIRNFTAPFGAIDAYLSDDQILAALPVLLERLTGAAPRS